MTNLFEDELKVYNSIKDIPKVGDLTCEGNSKYKISNYDDVLKPIVDKNDIIIVAGSYFGDEGKGKITNAISNEDSIKLVARTNSGENAGHTIIHDSKKYVFHLTPCAIAKKDKICCIGPECVMDPVTFVKKEIDNLIDSGIEYKNRLFVGNVHLVGPHHKILDFSLNPNNSSTLTGMSFAHASKIRKRGLRLDDLYNSREEQEKTLRKDLENYYALLKLKNINEDDLIKDLKKRLTNTKVFEHLINFLLAKDKIGFILDLMNKMVVNNPNFPKRKNIFYLLKKSLKNNEKILLESPQSYWLSNATENHWRSSTSAQTHAMGVLASSNINIAKYKFAVINVAKTPGDSRVGIGANPASFVSQDYYSKKNITSLDKIKDCCNNFDEIQRLYYESVQDNGILKPIEYSDKTGKYVINEAMAISSAKKYGEKGATTKKPRVTGNFDLVASYQVNEVQGPYLSISALDRGDFSDYVGLVVAYIFNHPNEKKIDSNGKVYANGDIIKIGDVYPNDNVLCYCHPIIKVMDSWKNSPISATKINESDSLPINLQKFISVIEKFTGFKVIAIGNGPDTKNVIYIESE
jgi:adenylosuccinate synthase